MIRNPAGPPPGNPHTDGEAALRGLRFRPVSGKPGPRVVRWFSADAEAYPENVDVAVVLEDIDYMAGSGADRDGALARLAAAWAAGARGAYTEGVTDGQDNADHDSCHDDCHDDSACVDGDVLARAVDALHAQAHPDGLPASLCILEPCRGVRPTLLRLEPARNAWPADRGPSDEQRSGTVGLEQPVENVAVSGGVL